MESLNTLQRILNSIETSLASGGPQLYAILYGFAALFAMLALLLVCYGMLWNGRVLPAAFGLLIRLGLVTFALTQWPWFLDGLRDMGVMLGLLVTGNQLSTADFLDPGVLIQTGMASAGVLWTAFKAHLGLTTPVTAFIFFLAWLAYCAAFAVMAYKVFWWQVEVLLAGAAGLCLLPTLAFQRTAFVATGVLSYAANMFARFLLGALLAGLLWKNLDVFGVVPVLARKVSEDTAIQVASAAVGTAWVLAACFLSVNRLAGMLTSGIPGMAGGQSVGGLVRMMATGMAATATVGGATVVMGLALTGGSRAALTAVQALHSGTSQRLGETARAIYAGAQDAAHGQGKLGQYMGDPTRLVHQTAQLTLQQLMRGTGQHDQTHGGARHH